MVLLSKEFYSKVLVKVCLQVKFHMLFRGGEKQNLGLLFDLVICERVLSGRNHQRADPRRQEERRS